jgi:hypothetical protein
MRRGASRRARQLGGGLQLCWCRSADVGEFAVYITASSSCWLAGVPEGGGHRRPSVSEKFRDFALGTRASCRTAFATAPRASPSGAST